MWGSWLIIFCAALWATDAIFRAPLSHNVDANTIVLLEHAIGVLLTFPLFFLRRHEIKQLKLKDWFAAIFVGVMGSALGTYFFTSAYRFINPSVVILLQKTQPLFALLGARFLLKEVLPRSFFGWGALAIFSSILISIPEFWNTSLEIQSSQGITYALLAASLWGFSTVFGKVMTRKLSFPVTSFLRFVFGFSGMLGLLFARIATYETNPSQIFAYLLSDPKAMQAILYMGLVPGVFAMYLYYAGLKRTQASVATFAELFFPIAAVLVNWHFLGQGLVPLQILGSALLLVSVYFINRKKR